MGGITSIHPFDMYLITIFILVFTHLKFEGSTKSIHPFAMYLITFFVVVFTHLNFFHNFIGIRKV